MRSCPSLLRPVPILLAAAMTLVLLCGPSGLPTAQANPLPGGMVIVHIHEPDPGFCANPPVTHCEEIQQYTEMTGLLQFDLFIYSEMLPYGVVTGVESTVGWPAEWICVEAGLCASDGGSVDVVGNEAAIFAEFTTADPELFVFPFASFLLEVTGEGLIEALDEVMMRTGTPPNETWEWIDMVPGHAGVSCGYTYMGCDYNAPCRPSLSPGELVFELPEGASSQQMIYAEAFYTPECVSAFDVIGDWLSLVVDEVGPHEWELTVTADATGLGAGEYTGWVRGEAQAPRCTSVTLLVTPQTQDIPGDWGPDTDALDTTWGALKSLYRK